MKREENLVTVIPSPVGSLKVSIENGKLVELSFAGSDMENPEELNEKLKDESNYKSSGIDNLKGLNFIDCEISAAKNKDNLDITNKKVLYNLLEQLDKYWEGELKHFDLPVEIRGTDFQKKVYKELMNIPYGTTVTYKEIAHKINNPRAVRAVGGANNSNSIAIIIPCHRVIGSDGFLVGYGGGIEKKKFLLELEGLSIENNKIKK